VKIRNNISLYLLVIFIISCSTKVTYTYEKFTKSYPDAKRVDVTVTFSSTEYTGLLSGHRYDNTESYSYSFQLSPGRIKWKNNGEPKRFVFCNNNVYLKYMVSSSNYDDTLEKVITKVSARYNIHQDDRYFFKLFGEQSWINISESKYRRYAEKCTEENIPNYKKIKYVAFTKLE